MSRIQRYSKSLCVNFKTQIILIINILVQKCDVLWEGDLRLVTVCDRGGG